jgi:hypothetical protein
MKQFYSHALMLLVQLADDGRSERNGPSKIDTLTTDQHISSADFNVQQSPSLR